MPLRSVKDVVDAVDAGRQHTQRFLKGTGAVGDYQWQDWAYATGQPGYDARVGIARAFNPFNAVGNDAIYFPPIPADMERRILGVTAFAAASGADQTNVEMELYDLIGVYPLIDGDSTDQQDMDNTLTMARYADGEGVRPVFVNHVAPLIQASSPTVNYVDSDGNAKSVVWRSTTAGQNKVNYSVSGNGGISSIWAGLAAGSRGVRAITSIQFNVAPGGLWAIYMCKPLLRTSVRGGLATFTQTVATEKCMCLNNGFSMPRVYDGAHLGFFYMPVGGVWRSTTLFGNITFVWG